MRRVAADQRDDDPRSEELRLGAPALLGEISPARAQQEDVQQGKQQRGDPEHGRGEKLAVDAAYREGHGGCRKLRVPLFCYADRVYMAEELTQLKGRSGLV